MYFTGQLMNQGVSSPQSHLSRNDAVLRAKCQPLIEVLTNPADIEEAKRMLGIR